MHHFLVLPLHQLTFYPGKSLMLYYILVMRLKEKKPTYFQINSTYLYRFDIRGVERIRVDGTPDNQTELYCALVDSNQHVTQPASFIQNSNTHVIYAASPQTKRINWAKYVGQKRVLCMEPWTWMELMQGYVSNIPQDRH